MTLGRSLALLLLLPFAASGDDSVSLADLPAYRDALRSSADAPVSPVSFRDLWDRPDTYRGKRVSVTGRVRRIFRQPAVGEFPPLVEAWVVTGTDDPICLVFPDAPIEAGSTLAFSGVYLKQIRYRGEDTDRLAPLIVGPRPPEASVAPQPAKASGRSRELDLMFGMVVAMIILLGLIRTFLRRPPRARPLDADPPPVFEDGRGA